MEKKGGVLGYTQVLAATTAYAACSMGMTMVNKALVRVYGVQENVALLAFQTMVGLVLLLIGRRVGWLQFENLRFSTLGKFLPLNACFIAMLFTSFQCLYYLPVALVTVFKSLTNIFIMLGDWYLYGEKPSKMLVSSAVMIVLGAVLTGYNDLEFNLTGYIWMGLNCAATLGYVLYMRKLSMLKMTKHGMTYHNLTLAVPISTLMAFNELPLFFGAEDRWTDFGFVFWAVMSGALGFIMAFASFWCMSVTSATTYCMVGALNKVPLAILGVWMFSEPVTWRLSLYIAIGLLGGILFSLSQTLEKEAKKQEPVKPESAKSPV